MNLKKLSKRAGLVLAGTAAASLLAAGTAFAGTPSGSQGGPNDNATVNVSGTVSLSCGFSSAPTALNFGNLTPGETATTSTSYAVDCDDSNGWAVYVSDAGPTLTSNDGGTQPSLNPSIYAEDAFVPATGGTAQELGQLWPAANGTNDPSQETQQDYSAAPVAVTDDWALNMPNATVFPGSLADQFTYSVFGQ